MTARLLQTVPNFSEGRDSRTIDAIAGAMAEAGATVLDISADADHNRAVVTAVGSPGAVEEAAVAGARVAAERIDMRTHDGVHPRIGACDVVPLVPLHGLNMEDARESARRVGERLAREVGLPVYFYGAASEPPGRQLAELRRGGYEFLVRGWPAGRSPDAVPAEWPYEGAHPSAGAVCVGARKLLLAWNVVLQGIAASKAEEIAREARESSGGFRGLRALALELPRRGVLQISMNLEDLDATAPMDVFAFLEQRIGEAGGAIVETEVIGLVPDALVTGAAQDRLRLTAGASARLLSRRLFDYAVAQNEDATNEERIKLSE